MKAVCNFFINASVTHIQQAVCNVNYLQSILQQIPYSFPLMGDLMPYGQQIANDRLLISYLPGHNLPANNQQLQLTCRNLPTRWKKLTIHRSIGIFSTDLPNILVLHVDVGNFHRVLFFFLI